MKKKLSKNLLALDKAIKNFPNWPKKGVVFKDIMPILQNPKTLKLCIQELIKKTSKLKYDVIVSSEARGFLFSIPLSLATNKKWVPCRKVGKLPGTTIKHKYDLEYGTATLEMQKGAIKPNDRVLIIDDLLATGGTVGAVIDLVKKCKAIPVAAAFVINLSFLPGEKILTKKHRIPVFSLLEYDHE